MIAEYVVYLEQNFCLGELRSYSNSIVSDVLRFVPKSEAHYSPGGGHHDQDACKQLVVEHFPAMHAMAMEKFFIPTEICMSEPVCGADPPTKPPGM